MGRVIFHDRLDFDRLWLVSIRVSPDDESGDLCVKDVLNLCWMGRIFPCIDSQGRY